MKVTVLTPEESKIFWDEEVKIRQTWTTEQIIDDAKVMLSMPDMGNTKWLLEEDYEGFYKWLETEEARAEWNKDPFTLTLAKYYAINKAK